VKRAGSTVDITSSNGSSGQLSRSDDFVIEDIAVNMTVGSPGYVEGIIRNLKIWTGGDRTTGTLVRWYPLNENSGTNAFDLIGGQDGSTVNITDNERELFIKDGFGDWIAADGDPVIEVA
jgi:hypothetical protein